MSKFYKTLPSDLRKSVTLRCAGYRPHPDLVERLKRFHPTVDLMWEGNSKRWVLVQTDQEPVHIISILTGPHGEYVSPDLNNTVAFLDQCSEENFVNAWALDRWMNKNLSDEDYVDPASEERAAANIREFSDRFWHLQGEKIAVVPHPSSPPSRRRF